MGPRGELPTAPVTYFCLSPRKNNNGTTARWLYTRYTNWTLGWSFTWRWEILASISINIIIHLVNGHSRILNWGYLPYIRPIKGLYKAYVGEYPTKYGLIWYSTSILGSWNSHWFGNFSDPATNQTWQQWQPPAESSWTHLASKNDHYVGLWLVCPPPPPPPQQFFKIANLSKDFN